MEDNTMTTYTQIKKDTQKIELYQSVVKLIEKMHDLGKDTNTVLMRRAYNMEKRLYNDLRLISLR